MFRRTIARLAMVVVLTVGIWNSAGCTPTSGQVMNESTRSSTAMPATAADSGEAQGGQVVGVDVDRIPFTNDGTLQELMHADLVIEGTVVRQTTRLIRDLATEAELAERESHGDVTGTPFTDSEILIDEVLKGQAPSATITVTQFGGAVKDTTIMDLEEPLLRLDDKVILFLRDISGDPVQAPSQTKYMIAAPVGQFRIEKDNTLSAHLPVSRNPVADAYRRKDKSILEQDILDLVTKLSPEQIKEEALQAVLSGVHLIIEGTIQEVREVRLIPIEGKTQEWINQMLAEGKMPGMALTDYTVTVDQIIFDRFANQPRFFPNREPIKPGQTIVVTLRGGMYQGVTQVREPIPPFEIGSREILFLVDLGVANEDPDYHSPGYQVRYGLIDSRLGRLLIGPDNKLTAFTTKGLGRTYGGQDVGQLELDITEFLKTHPSYQNIPVPPQP